MNLVSNDVRRFDDAMPFWVFLWVGPLELTCVLVLLSIQLGAPAAFAGVATMLLVIPLQVCQLSLPAYCIRIKLNSPLLPCCHGMTWLLEPSTGTCEVLLGSRFIGESISLKNVRQFYCLTPHWNDSMADEAIGRLLGTSHTSRWARARRALIYTSMHPCPLTTPSTAWT